MAEACMLLVVYNVAIRECTGCNRPLRARLARRMDGWMDHECEHLVLLCTGHSSNEP